MLSDWNARAKARMRNSSGMGGAPAGRFAYTIRLSKSAMKSLRFIADRYLYAEVLIDGLYEDEPGVYRLSEATAWAFRDAVEEEDGYLPLAGGELQEAMTSLLDSIV